MPFCQKIIHRMVFDQQPAKRYHGSLDKIYPMCTGRVGRAHAACEARRVS